MFLVQTVTLCVLSLFAVLLGSCRKTHSVAAPLANIQMSYGAPSKTFVGAVTRTAADFGVVKIHFARYVTFTLSNVGHRQASSLDSYDVPAPFYFRGGSYPGTGGTCGDSLAAGSSCTIVIAFLPTTATTTAATLRLTYFDGADPSSINQLMTGISILQPAVLSISESEPYDYGTLIMHDTSDKTFTVTNSGDGPAMSVSGSFSGASFIFKGGSYPGTGGTCDTTISGYGTCTVVVQFAPLTRGNLSDTLVLSYDDSEDTLTASRGVQGTAIAVGPTGIVSFWKTEEASGTRFDELGINNLVNLSGPTFSSTGIVGNAALFTTASPTVVRLFATSQLAFSAHDFTMTGWVYYTTMSSTTNNPAFGKGNSGNGGANVQEYVVYANPSKAFIFQTSNGVGSCTLNSGVTGSAGNWYFIAAWYDAAAQRSYIQVNNNTAVSGACTTGTADLGYEFALGRTVDYFLNGKIDAVGVWSRVLTNSERTNLYNSGAGLEYPF